MEKPAYIISNSKVNQHGGNIFTHANESSPIPHIFTLSIHKTWLIEWDVNRLMGGQGSGKWTEALRLEDRSSLESLFQLLFSSRWYRACLRAVCNQAPTSLHLSDCIRGAWTLQCPIHKRAEPSRQPTQMLHTLTSGHPPTLCCVNDSLPHITVKTSRLCPCDQWKLCWKKVSLWNFSSRPSRHNEQHTKGQRCWADWLTRTWKQSNVNAGLSYSQLVRNSVSGLEWSIWENSLRRLICILPYDLHKLYSYIRYEICILCTFMSIYNVFIETVATCCRILQSVLWSHLPQPNI